MQKRLLAVVVMAALSQSVMAQSAGPSATQLDQAFSMARSSAQNELAIKDAVINELRQEVAKLKEDLAAATKKDKTKEDPQKK